MSGVLLRGGIDMYHGGKEKTDSELQMCVTGKLWGEFLSPDHGCIDTFDRDSFAEINRIPVISLK